MKGVQWGLGAVGNAEWTGVPLSVLLDRAVVRPGAREVILEGADRGKVDDPKAPAGELKFARSIPLAKARQDVLLAYKMNGVDLAAGAWFSGPGDCSRLVRGRVDQMAATNHRVRRSRSTDIIKRSITQYWKRRDNVPNSFR